MNKLSAISDKYEEDKGMDDCGRMKILSLCAEINTYE
jgi:hypothetical protein